MNQPHETVHLPGDGLQRLTPPEGYQVPPGTAQNAALASLRPIHEQPVAPPKPPPEPTTTDKLQQDAETPAALPDWPDGAPEFRPLMRLPFGQRAQAMELLGEVQKLAGNFGNEGDDVTPETAAAMYRAYDKLDQLLASVAVDRAAYEAWDGRYDDSQFTALWTAYQARMNPGEASRSSS